MEAGRATFRVSSTPVSASSTCVQLTGTKGAPEASAESVARPLLVCEREIARVEQCKAVKATEREGKAEQGSTHPSRTLRRRHPGHRLRLTDSMTLHHQERSLELIQYPLVGSTRTRQPAVSSSPDRVNLASRRFPSDAVVHRPP